MANIDKNLFAGEMSDVNRAMEKLVNLCVKHVWQEQNRMLTVPYFVTLQSRGKRNFLAWVSSQKVWCKESTALAYELNVATETLDRPLEETYLTVLHELCHLWNLQYNVKDVTAGQRHNQKFANACDCIGLFWEKNKQYGIVTSDDLSKQNEFIQTAFAKIKKAMGKDVALLTIREDRGQPAKKKEKKKSNQIKYECPCCHKSLRATSKLRVICGDCNVEFINVNEAADETAADDKITFETVIHDAAAAELAADR